MFDFSTIRFEPIGSTVYKFTKALQLQCMIVRKLILTNSSVQFILSMHSGSNYYIRGITNPRVGGLGGACQLRTTTFTSSTQGRRDSPLGEKTSVLPWKELLPSGKNCLHVKMHPKYH